MIQTVLFDLDGTLIDTAPDMAAALNRLRAEQDLDALPFAAIRPHVSHGSTAMIQVGFDHEQGSDEFERLRLRFLDIYKQDLVIDSALFTGMGQVLDNLEQQGRRWGVVTNKPSWLTEPLLEGLQLHERAGCIISGDSLPERKPHPMPLLHACKLMQAEAPDCVYVGDAERDIESGRRAGMHTLVAEFGYIDAEEDPNNWGADAMISEPAGLLDWLEHHD